MITLKVGYEFVYDCAGPTPMMLALSIHHSRAPDLIVPDYLRTSPSVPVEAYRDSYGNWCSRLVAPKGTVRLTSSALLRDSGTPDEVVPGARQVPVQHLPTETIEFLLGSRYCETDLLTPLAWELFGRTPEGWSRVQAICDFVHEHVTFSHAHARSTKTARDVFEERAGVCRDFAHLAIAFTRSMNIPARYCTGYISDVGTPLPRGDGDFAAWFEAYLDGRWYVFDPRNNEPRIGRVLIARGRDAADVPLSLTFGENTLTSFKVWADEVDGTSPDPW